VTSCDVKVIGETTDYCKGETLFISATLARLLSVEELSAVLGHELGHFSGKDTLYSLKFAPVYAGLRDAVSAINLNDNDGGLALVKIPALLLFTYMVDAFSTNESFVSRKREHEADKAAIEVSSASHLATALMKVTIYSGLWDKIRTDNIARLNKGKVVSNLSQTFVDSAKYDIEHEKLTSIVEFALSEKISHPTDTHPTLAERLSNLNVDFSTISKEMLLAPEVSASGKIDKYEEIEQNITIFEHQLMIALDRVQLPKEEKDNYFLKMTYCFAAAMVRVDGKIENDEIAVAEEIGMRLFSDFDSAEFREYFSGELELATVTSLAEVLKDAVDQETKEQIYSYLRLIAAADDEISAEEEALLSEIARAMDFVPISNTEPKQAVANQ
jgi:tellurite resistance protein